MASRYCQFLRHIGVAWFSLRPSEASSHLASAGSLRMFSASLPDHSNDTRCLRAVIVPAMAFLINLAPKLSGHTVSTDRPVLLPLRMSYNSNFDLSLSPRFSLLSPAIAWLMCVPSTGHQWSPDTEAEPEKMLGDKSGTIVWLLRLRTPQ